MEKLPSAFYDYKTTYKNPIGMSPYHLIYGKACHLLVEIEHQAYWVIKQLNFSLDHVGKHHLLQVQKL